MKLRVSRTSDTYGTQPQEMEFNTVEELIAFSAAQDEPLILHHDLSLEIYDDYRE